MSDLSVAKNDILGGLKTVGDFFAKIITPGTQAQASSVASQLASVASSAKALIPAVADEIANAALAQIPGGAGFSELADEVINLVIAKLEAAKSTTQAAQAPAAA